MEHNAPEIRAARRFPRAWLPENRMWKGLIQLGIAGLVVFYLVQSVGANWAQIRNHSWHLNYGWLSLSVLLQIGSLMMMAGGWYAALRLLGAEINFWHAQRIWIITNFLKYIPGKVWIVFARILHAHHHGVPKIVTLTSFAYEFVLFISSGVVISACTVPFWFHQGEAQPYWWTLLLVPLILMMLHPAFFGPMVNRALKLVKRPPLAQQIRFSRLLLLWLYFGLAWTLFSLAFCLFVTAVQPLPLATWPTLGGAFVASFVLGLLVVFIPGGLGVREGLLMVILSSLCLAYLPPEAPHGTAVVLALGSRVWMVFSEVLALGLAVAFIRDLAASSWHLQDLAQAGEILETED